MDTIDSLAHDVSICIERFEQTIKICDEIISGSDTTNLERLQALKLKDETSEKIVSARKYGPMAVSMTPILTNEKRDVQDNVGERIESKQLEFLIKATDNRP